MDRTDVLCDIFTHRESKYFQKRELYDEKPALVL